MPGSLAKERTAEVRFLQVSTDEVYGSSDGEVAFTEEHPLKPNNPYSASKASGDLLVARIFKPTTSPP